MRHKLERFNFSGLQALTASRCVRALTILKELVNPRVSAAVLRTLFNGWCTSHRFQGSGNCLFNCSYWAKDKLEHYAVCPHVISFGKKFLNLYPGPDGIQPGQFITMGLNEGSVSDDTLVRRAIWIFSVYRTMSEVAHGTQLNSEELQELMRQFAREAVRGHGISPAILENCFNCRGSGYDTSATEEPPQDWDVEI